MCGGGVAGLPPHPVSLLAGNLLPSRAEVVDRDDRARLAVLAWALASVGVEQSPGHRQQGVGLGDVVLSGGETVLSGQLGVPRRIATLDDRSPHLAQSFLAVGQRTVGRHPLVSGRRHVVRRLGPLEGGFRRALLGDGLHVDGLGGEVGAARLLHGHDLADAEVGLADVVSDRGSGLGPLLGDCRHRAETESQCDGNERAHKFLSPCAQRRVGQHVLPNLRLLLKHNYTNLSILL